MVESKCKKDNSPSGFHDFCSNLSFPNFLVMASSSSLAGLGGPGGGGGGMGGSIATEEIIFSKLSLSPTKVMLESSKEIKLLTTKRRFSISSTCSTILFIAIITVPSNCFALLSKSCLIQYACKSMSPASAILIKITINWNFPFFIDLKFSVCNGIKMFLTIH